MSESPIDVRLSVDDSRAIASLRGVQIDLVLTGLFRSLAIAESNGYRPIRWVLGRKLHGLLGGYGSLIYGLPVVEGDSELGYGLILRRKD